MMKFSFYMILMTLIFQGHLQAQDTTAGNPVKQIVPHYKVSQAIEAESLFPMFFSGGYHFAMGYRYGKFRLRVSVINGGSYNAEPAGVKNQKDDFKRFYKTSPGVFLGYNVWKNLELYTYMEMHTFSVQQKSSGMKRDIRSDDFGGGLSYQFFFGRRVYLQPGFHLYLRSDKSRDFNGERYSIPNVDISPVVRIGFRLWEKE